MTTPTATELHKLKHRLATERWRRKRAERRAESVRSSADTCMADMRAVVNRAQRYQTSTAADLRDAYAEADRRADQRDKAVIVAVGAVLVAAVNFAAVLILTCGQKAF